MNHIRFILFLLPAVILSCGGPARPALKDIDSYIRERPDSAWTALQSLDTTTLHTQGDRAYYRLLMAMALDKNNIDDGSYVHEAASAADWYERHRDLRRRMLSHYYYGDQLYDGGNNTQAAIFFTLAAEEAETLQDWFYAGMAQRSLGDIALLVSDRPAQLEYYRQSTSSFIKADKPLHAAYAELEQAKALSANRMDRSADSMFLSSMEKGRGLKDTVLLADIFFQYARHCIHREPDSLIKAGALLDSAFNSYQRYPSSDDLSSLGLYYSMIGLTDKALDCIDAAFTQSENRRDSLAAIHARYYNNRNIGNVLDSFKDLETILEAVDSVARSPLKQEILKDQVSLYRKESRLQKYHKRLYQLVLVFSIVVFSLLIFLLSFWNKRLHLEKQLEIYRIKEELEAERIVSEELRNKLSFARYPALDMSLRIFEQLCKVYTMKTNDKEMVNELEYQLDQLRNSDNFKRELDQLMEQLDPGIVEYLAEQEGSLPMSQDEWQVLYYMVAGLPNAMIAALMGKKIGTTSMIMTRIRRHIYDADSSVQARLDHYLVTRSPGAKRGRRT